MTVPRWPRCGHCSTRQTSASVCMSRCARSPACGSVRRRRCGSRTWISCADSCMSVARCSGLAAARWRSGSRSTGRSAWCRSRTSCSPSSRRMSSWRTGEVAVRRGRGRPAAPGHHRLSLAAHRPRGGRQRPQPALAQALLRQRPDRCRLRRCDRPAGARARERDHDPEHVMAPVAHRRGQDAQGGIGPSPGKSSALTGAARGQEGPTKRLACGSTR